MAKIALLASALVWTLTTAAQTHSSTPLRAEKQLGLTVEDSDGRKIGTVRNLVIDTQSGRLKYIVVASGGLIGIHATLKLAPTQIMSAATTKRDTLAINVPMERWQHAPVFKSSDLASLGQPGRVEEISRYFEQAEVRSTVSPKAALTATGHIAEVPPPAHAETLKFASDLIGSRVVNKHEEKVGEIQDFLISFGQPHEVFAVVSTGKLFHHERQAAIPLIALSSNDKSKKLTADVDNSTLQQSPPFDQQAWQSYASNKLVIYSYLKTVE